MLHVVALDAISRTTLYAVVIDGARYHVARSDDASVTWSDVTLVR